MIASPGTGVLIARREGLKVVVQSGIDKIGSGYRLSLAAIDPSNETVLTSAIEDARDEAAVLGAVDRLARKVRLALGESKSEMDKAAAAETFTAGSLGAMQAYIRAQDLANGGRVQEASTAYRDAIAQDPLSAAPTQGWRRSIATLAKSTWPRRPSTRR